MKIKKIISICKTKKWNIRNNAKISEHVEFEGSEADV